jgi:hypothetical protein
VGYCLHAVRRLGYITDATYSELESEIKQAYAPLAGLIRSAHTLPTVLAVLGGVMAGAVLMLIVQQLAA